MLGGCAVGSGEVRDLSTEKAARLIIDGRTTMAQIDAELGEPDYEIHMGHEIVRHYPKSRSKRSRYSSENDVLIEKSVKYTDFFLLSIVYV